MASVPLHVSCVKGIRLVCHVDLFYLARSQVELRDRPWNTPFGHFLELRLHCVSVIGSREAVPKLDGLGYWKEGQDRIGKARLSTPIIPHDLK